MRKYADTQGKERPEISEEETKEFYEFIKSSQELSDFKEWDVRTLSILDSDRWPERMLRVLFCFTEKLIEIPEDERKEKAQPTIPHIQKLFSNLPYWEGEREVLTKEFLEILNLPIWNRRHELYQTWVLTQIDKALKDYQRTIYHVNGALILRFSGTHIGTIETERGRIHIWSELRSPLANPLGRGRKGHIQPDYSLTFEPITAPSQTVVAIECKQYRKANPKNFAEALIDYARGRPNAKVLLVNHSEIPEKILDRVDDNLKAQTRTVGNFIPNNLKETGIFKQELLDSLPGFTAKREDGDAIKEMQFNLIAVDISGSMKNVLKEEGVLRILQMIVNSFPTAKLLAIDTTVKKEWSKAKIGLQELLDLPKDGGTDLPKALSDCDLGYSVVLTDDSGWNQLSNMSFHPYLVIEVGSEKEVEKALYFHFRE